MTVGGDFPRPSTRALGPSQTRLQWAPDHSRVKRPGRVRNYPPLPSTEVTELLEL